MGFSSSIIPAAWSSSNVERMWYSFSRKKIYSYSPSFCCICLLETMENHSPLHLLVRGKLTWSRIRRLFTCDFNRNESIPWGEFVIVSAMFSMKILDCSPATASTSNFSVLEKYNRPVLLRGEMFGSSPIFLRSANLYLQTTQGPASLSIGCVFAEALKF